MKGLELDTNIAIDILNGKKEIAEICFKYYLIIIGEKLLILKC